MKTQEFSSYYKSEINLLREVGKEYAKKQPLVASYLSETSNDPDTERLIEATAFLNANLKKELDDSFGIFSNDLIDIIYPDVVKSKPSVSIVEISPTSNLSEKLFVKKGSYFNSKKVNNVTCKFGSTWDLNVYPIKLLDVIFKDEVDESSHLKLTFQSSAKIKILEMSTLDFFINMPLPNSYTLVKMLMNNLKGITLEYENKKIPIQKENLINLGFENDHNLFTYNRKTLQRFKLLNEYFSFPRKNLFFRFENMLKYSNLITGNKFSIVFDFDISDLSLLDMKKISILLYCIPVANIFMYDTEPVKINYLNETVKVVTSFNEEENYLLYEINEVRGLKNSNPQRNTYAPFNHFNDGEYVYKFFRKKALGDFRQEEGYLQVFYKNTENIDDLLAINANVTNGALCESLQIGDINLSSENSPEYCTFSNVIIPSTYIESPIDDERLTFIISHISTNIFGLNDIEDLKTILKFYVADYSRDKERNKINLKKIASLDKLSIEDSTKLKNGMLINGKEINISMDSSEFVNISEMYIFSHVIFNFFKYSIAINNFVYLKIVDTYSGESFILS